MKFTLTCQHSVYNGFTGQKISDNGDKLTSEFEAEDLDKILESFECFLRGCGFHPSGHLMFTENE